MLEGGGTEAEVDFVAANAGAAIHVGGGEPDLRAGVERAREILASGAAADVLDRLAEASQEEARRT